MGLDLHVWHDSSTCLTWLIHMCGKNKNNKFQPRYAMWGSIYMCDITRPHVWHDSFICVKKIKTINFNPGMRCGARFICVTWLVHTCDMTHSYVWHDSRECVYDIWMSHGARMNDQIWSKKSFDQKLHLNNLIIHTWMIQKLIWSFIRAPWLSHVCHAHSCDVTIVWSFIQQLFDHL